MVIVMEKALLSRKTLAERWDFTSTQVIENYEAQGIITRVLSLPTPRYSLSEIEKIEMVEDINPLSPIERKRLERKIEQLQAEIERYRRKFEIIRSQVL